MRTTIDKAGRIVIPRALREEVGLGPGEVEVVADGTAIRIEPLAGEGFVEEDGWFAIPASGTEIDDEWVRGVRLADQR